jgi:hypothetical protein
MSNIRLNTENFQLLNGHGLLSEIVLSSRNGVKFFEFTNTGASSETLLVRSYPAGITLGPLGPSSIVIPGASGTTFSVGYYVRGSGNDIDDFIAFTGSTGPIHAWGTASTTTRFAEFSISTEYTSNNSYRDNYFLYGKNKDGEYLVDEPTSSETIGSDSSFSLLRANPKLSGNVKLTVDSSENIWLNSILSTKELSDDKYRKFPITANGSFASDLKKFFGDTSTPPEIVFGIYQDNVTYTSSERTLDKQYDTFYHYGMSLLVDKFYDEEFSFFAPLAIKEDLPDYFAIFRVNGPLNTTTYNDFSSRNFAEDILSNSEIVKTYDLTENSAIGKYLRNILSHPSRKKNDVSISLQADGYTTFNGISYEDGSFVQKGELLGDFFSQENPILSVDEFISLGFQRNKVISTSVINLEFLFDDDRAENYSINRYFGLYVKRVPLAEFQVSEGLAEFSSEIGQTPSPRRNVDGTPQSMLSFTQTNEDGIVIFANSDSLTRLKDRDIDYFSFKASEFYYDDEPSFFVVVPGEFDYNPYLKTGHTVNIEGIRYDTGATFDGICTFYDADTTTYTDLSWGDKKTIIELRGFTSSTSFADMALSLAAYPTETTFSFDREGLSDYRKREIFSNDYIENQPRIFYLKDRLNGLHNVKGSSGYTVHVDDFTTRRDVGIRLHQKEIDMSLFTGITDLMTQTSATLLSKGRASLVLEFSDSLSEGNYLEVSWPYGSTAEPHRWRIQASSSFLNPGENWPDYSIENDGSLFYLSQFHPGLNSDIPMLVQSMRDSFYVFPYMNFDVVNVDNMLIFRMKSEGEAGNDQLLSFQVGEGAFSISGISCTASGNVNFNGGNDRNRRRAKIELDVAKGILESESFKTRNGYSDTQKYSIFGNNIPYSAYLEEEIVEKEKIVGYTGMTGFGVISTENDSEFFLTSDSKVSSFKEFYPEFGMLSVYPIKDYDSDTYSSEYARTYAAELSMYYSLTAGYFTVTGISGPQGATGATTMTEVYFDKSFSSGATYVAFATVYDDGRNPIVYNENAHLRFSSAGPTATLMRYVSGVTAIDTQMREILSIGDRVVILSGKSALYAEDEELRKFKGFQNLLGVFGENDSKLFEKYEKELNPKKFQVQQLGSEYERLNENFLTSLADKSKVVPYICKWVSYHGTDVRNNPYRFNTSRAFGEMGFSPLIDSEIADPKSHTHEWPMLAKVPSKISPIDIPEFCFSYFFEDDSNYDFESIDRDWFSAYFEVGYPTEISNDLVSQLNISDAVIGSPVVLVTETANEIPTLDRVSIPREERYSIFRYDPSIQRTFTMFRGAKIEIVNDSVSEGSNSFYDGYRFSSIIVPSDEESFVYEDKISAKIIVNDKFKFILYRISCSLSSYRTMFGSLSYLDMYTAKDKRDYALYSISSSKTTGSTASAGYQFIKTLPADFQLSSPLDFSQLSPDYAITPGIQNPYDSFGDSTLTDFTKEITPLASGKFSKIGGIYLASDAYTFTIISPEVKNVFDKETIEFKDYRGYFFNPSMGIDIEINLPDTSKSWENYYMFYLSGGDGAFQQQRDLLSFAELSKAMLGTSEKIQCSISRTFVDGSTGTTGGFSVNFLTPEKIQRVQEFVPVNDENIPSELFSYGVIGSNLILENSKSILNRHQGEFIPKYKDIVLFALREDNEITVDFAFDFRSMNTRFFVENPSNGLMKNMHFVKVADSEIMKIPSGSAYKSLYPYVEEIAIDTRDFYVWSSSWEKSYYRKYLSADKFVDIDGIEQLIEERSFMASKAMKIPDEIDLYQFNVEEELTLTEDDVSIKLAVNLYDRLLRELKGSTAVEMASAEFRRLYEEGIIGEEEIIPMTEDYLRKNIMSSYEISELLFYVLESGNPGSPSRNTVEYTLSNDKKFTLAEKSLLNAGYSVKKDLSILYDGTLNFTVTYPLDSRLYTSVSVGVKLRRI